VKRDSHATIITVNYYVISYCNMYLMCDSLQLPDGSFMGDKWGEVDTRFSYCALSILSIIGELESGAIDVPKAIEFVGRYV
jgi:prenyltransferase beta subunit